MPQLRLTRRQFLRLAVLGGLGVAAAAFERVTRPVGADNYLRWTARGLGQQLAGRPAPVALGQCPSYGDDVHGCLRELWRLADLPDVAGKRVLVKPNLIDIVEGSPTTTSPILVGAVLDLLAELGVGEVAVGEGPGFRREAWPVVEGCGLAAVLAARKVPFVDLNYDDPQPVPVRDGWFRRTNAVWLPRHVREADLVISVPKLKTHHWAGVTLSLKNLFGIVPGARYGWPKNMLHVNSIPASIVGLYQLVRPMVAIVDGIVGMEGDGPLFGTGVPHGVLAAGADPVAVDSTCARLMGFDPQKVGYLWLAGWAGVGQVERVETRGGSVEQLRRHYQAPPGSALRE
ncbi:MAG: DUF362 domain-containing protein [Chloroflexi bacterium]|nr:DUF362 domain-containing protein [Chloroflexota bacterium]